MNRAEIAANNNADLYQAVFKSWDLRFARHPYAFVALDRPPPYYSNLVILSEKPTDDIVSLILTAAQEFDGAVGIKDGFCALDLKAYGFEVLFAASWFWRDAQPGVLPSGWMKVENEHALERWEDAWKRSGSPTSSRMFRDALLCNPDITILGKVDAGDVVAGCIANKSSDCIGISNVFSEVNDGNVFEDATSAVASVAPNLPIVGYKSEVSLKAVQKAGYQLTGKLRILVAENARF